MEYTDGQRLGRYASVSSLYGPGTITCWYLTILSVIVSWILHPKKRKSGSIDADMIAMLTLPIVAASDFISQVSTLKHRHEDSPQVKTEVAKYVQSIAAIEAPLAVIESFMAISVILFLLAVRTVCVRRALSVALVGLLCLATECYFHFSSSRELGIRYTPSDAEDDGKAAFSRSFVADFTSLIIAIPAILFICAFSASVIVSYMLYSRKTLQEARRLRRRRLDEDREASQEADEISRSMVAGIPPNIHQLMARSMQLEEISLQNHERKAKQDSRIMRVIALTSFVFIPQTALLSIIPTITNAFGSAFSYITSNGRAITFWGRLKIFANHFYPRSGNSFSDLDQAVATIAGATVLAFSVYSVAKARYKSSSSEQTGE